MLRVIERTERGVAIEHEFPSIEGLEYRVITLKHYHAILHLAGQKGKKVNMIITEQFCCQTFDPIAYSVEFVGLHGQKPFSLMLYKEFPKSKDAGTREMLGELANGFVSAFLETLSLEQTQDVCYLMRPTLRVEITVSPKYGFTSDPSVVPPHDTEHAALYQRLGFEAVTKHEWKRLTRLLEVQMLDITCFCRSGIVYYIYELHVLSEPLFEDDHWLVLSNSGRAQMYFRGLTTLGQLRERIQDLRPVADQQLFNLYGMDKNDLTVEFSGRDANKRKAVTELIGTL
ncbi:hypothetical protein SPFM15_00176 [Salmonella phage SPFM15]|nr:hypothetical protein SPFM5_00171 [Salmonella phage SPFM5]VFR13800.1 hypothetical protein SPFM15_00176 [Salmonella phage SPFM15]